MYHTVCSVFSAYYCLALRSRENRKSRVSKSDTSDKGRFFSTEHGHGRARRGNNKIQDKHRHTFGRRDSQR